MIPKIAVNELVDRIREAASRENGLSGGARRDDGSSVEMPPVPEPPPAPPTPGATPAGASETVRPESLLDQAEALLRAGQLKNGTPKGVPKLFRSLFRNQGGFNGLLLAATGRLVDANRALRQQNYELQERLMYFHAWAHAVAETSVEDREWMTAAAARLHSLGHTETASEENQTQSTPAANSNTDLQPIETRLAQLTAHLEAAETERRALNDHLNRLRVQINEQAEYIGTVHRHLDALGAHVDTSLARMPPAA